jgi:hypothetical protein
MSKEKEWDPYSINRLQHLSNMAGILLYYNEILVDENNKNLGRKPDLVIEKELSLLLCFPLLQDQLLLSPPPSIAFVDDR